MLTYPKTVLMLLVMAIFTRIMLKVFLAIHTETFNRHDMGLSRHGNSLPRLVSRLPISANIPPRHVNSPLYMVNLMMLKVKRFHCKYLRIMPKTSQGTLRDSLNM
jgi:hypothetical protein